MILAVEFSKKALKFLEKSETPVAKRLFNAITEIKNNPFPVDVKRVENQWFENEKVFRIRVGDYRILYSINYQKNRLMVVNIDKRSRIY